MAPLTVDSIHFYWTFVLCKAFYVAITQDEHISHYRVFIWKPVRPDDTLSTRWLPPPPPPPSCSTSSSLSLLSLPGVWSSASWCAITHGAEQPKQHLQASSPEGYAVHPSVQRGMMFHAFWFSSFIEKSKISQSFNIKMYINYFIGSKITPYIASDVRSDIFIHDRKCRKLIGHFLQRNVFCYLGYQNIQHSCYSLRETVGTFLKISRPLSFNIRNIFSGGDMYCRCELSFSCWFSAGLTGVVSQTISCLFNIVRLPGNQPVCISLYLLTYGGWNLFKP